jgi:hypothetical protein
VGNRKSFISSEMISAGVDALRFYQEPFAEEMLVEAIYSAMVAQRAQQATGQDQEEQSASPSS